MTASAFSAPRATSSGSSRSPRWTPAPAAASVAAPASDRARPTTAWPAPISSATTAEPTNPVAPVTKMRMVVVPSGRVRAPARPHRDRGWRPDDPCDIVRNSVAIVRNCHGPALRRPLAPPAAELHVRRLRRRRRLVRPVPGPGPDHQVRGRRHRPLLARCRERCRAGGARAGRLLRPAARPPVPPREPAGHRPDGGARHVRERAPRRHGRPQWRRRLHAGEQPLRARRPPRGDASREPPADHPHPRALGERGAPLLDRAHDGGARR